MLLRILHRASLHTLYRACLYGLHSTSYIVVPYFLLLLLKSFSNVSKDGGVEEVDAAVDGRANERLWLLDVVTHLQPGRQSWLSSQHT